MTGRKSRWTVRLEKAIVGELAERPMSTAQDIAETLRRGHTRISARLALLEQENRVVRHVIEVPSLLGGHTPRAYWMRADITAELDNLITDEPNEERS